jgi:hypothetical protein
MESEIEVRTAGHSRSQHSPPLLRLLLIPDSSEQVPAWIAADLVGRDAPISVWWDYPP